MIEQNIRALIIDDDRDLLQLTKLLLSRAGVTVYTAPGGLDGLRQFYTHAPHLVIIDLMMPDVDGREVCRHIRQNSSVPIIMLTALTADKDIVSALDAGADDYLTKPFSPQVLLARSRAVLRRAALPPDKETVPIYDDGYLTINPNEHRVLINGKAVKLTPTEFRLLVYLFSNAKRIMTFQQILAAVWGEEYVDHNQYVHVYIRRLREKIEPEPQNPVYLTTEHGIGYQFEMPALR